MDIVTFQDAIQEAQAYTKRHILLGNGFSIACRHDIFAYKALFDRADFSAGGPLARAAFDALGSTDFEEVMRGLRAGAKLLRAYGPEGGPIADDFMRALAALRNILVSTIASQHPDKPADISEAQYRSCRHFLSNFNCIYTLNYDLLLYWTIMQKELGGNPPSDDGFRTPPHGPASYVSWEVENSDGQDVFYLHGALHLFDAGAELQKYTWINTGRRLTEQIREALEQDLYPLIVAEGESMQKKAKIMHSNYLSRGYRSIPKIGGALFIYGHSLASNDEHILRLVDRSRVQQVFVSIFGDPASPENRIIERRAKEFGSTRRTIPVVFYDAASAKVWG
jgi:hypothetical protein